LSKMAKGFRSAEAGGAPVSVHPGTGAAADAARVLAEIARVAGRPAVNLEALPFGDAQIPAILRAGQGKYLSNLLFRGRADVQAALGVAPSTEVVRPTDSELDGPSLIQLVARGTRVVLVDPGFLPSPAQGGLTFSPPSVVRLTSGTRSAEAVIPDAGVAALAAGYPGDPQLAAHAALGELAATWLEFPGTPGRGAAMLFPEGPRYPAALAGIMANLVGASPWLHPVHASDLAAAITPQAAARVPARTYPRFDPAYIDRLRAARRSLNEFDHAVVGAEALKAALGDDLLGCLGGTFVADPAAGDRYIGAVVTAVRQTFSKLTLPASGTTVTLTSQRATLPLTIVNASAYPIHARVVLTADRRLVFGSGGTREVTIPPKGLTIQFGVSARTTGRFPMRVLVQTPGGEATIVQTQIVVRSTAYNRVALLLTIGAALFLAVWWGRRFLPRRTSA
ncbi:MAG TPA: DUF6049 family protein, partial [Actinomycetota bacterium]|nr:DUF6049 family protein [Actinomycetota bacterium]